MCVDGGVARCAGQVFVFSVGDVLSSAVVSVLLRQAKVNKEQLVRKREDMRGAGLMQRQGEDKDNCKAAAAVLNVHRSGWKTPRCRNPRDKTSPLSPSNGSTLFDFTLVLQQKWLNPSFISSHGGWNFSQL